MKAQAAKNREGIIREYFRGWEKKDWSSVEGALAPGFTFTSPNEDDHIDRHRYKEKCWPEAERMERFDVDKVIENGEEAFAQYRLWMKDGRLIRNTEYFRFLGGKIEKIEVFFGNAQAYG